MIDDVNDVEECRMRKEMKVIPGAKNVTEIEPETECENVGFDTV